MPTNIKIKQFTKDLGAGRNYTLVAADGVFLTDGNVRCDEDGNVTQASIVNGVVMPDGERVSKMIPGEVVEVDDGHPILNPDTPANSLIEITTQEASRSVVGLYAQPKKRRRPRKPRKDRTNAVKREEEVEIIDG